MRKFSGLSAYLLVSLAAVRGAIAAPVLCLTTGTYQDLLNTNPGGGCTISAGAGASLIFSNFTFTPAGVGTPAASAMGYTLDDPGVGIGGMPIFGFEFNPGLAVTGTVANPNAIQDILISYLVVPVGTAIVSAHLLQNAAATGAGLAQVSEDLKFCIASDPNNTSGTCRVFPGLLVSTAGSSHLEATFGAWTSQTVSKDINASSGAVGGTATISEVRDAVDLTAVVPEPTTYGLSSVGLLAFGYLARRRRAEGGTLERRVPSDRFCAVLSVILRRSRLDRIVSPGRLECSLGADLSWCLAQTWPAVETPLLSCGDWSSAKAPAPTAPRTNSFSPRDPITMPTGCSV